VLGIAGGSAYINDTSGINAVSGSVGGTADLIAAGPLTQYTRRGQQRSPGHGAH